LFATTKRYLLHLMLKNTRFSATMLAFAYTRLASSGERQSAFRVSCCVGSARRRFDDWTRST
jgi:hypothetical protein